MFKFNVTDVVYVKWNGKCYPDYKEFLEFYGVSTIHFKKGREIGNYVPVTIIAKGLHGILLEPLYAVKTYNGEVYVMGEDGLTEDNMELRIELDAFAKGALGWDISEELDENEEIAKGMGEHIISEMSDYFSFKDYGVAKRWAKDLIELIEIMEEHNE